MARIEEIYLPYHAMTGRRLQGQLAGRGLGDVTLPPAVYSEAARRWALHGVALLAVNVGGALTGYLAAGDGMGALIGSNVSTALWGFGQAVAGYQLTSSERAAFIATALLSTASTGYLFLRRRKRR